MTEFEKMTTGQPYNALDSELRQRRATARLACAKFNTHPSHGNMKHITRLFGSLGSLGNLGNLDRSGSTILEPGFQCDYGSNIHVGSHFYANFQCILLDAANITIGDHVLLGPGVHIYTVDHPKDASTRRQATCSARPVNIGNDVWIGGGAKILPGISIGDGAIIGANAVVTKNIAANTIYV